MQEREYIRLFGFPDFFRVSGDSAERRQKQIGNMVALPIGRAIGQARLALSCCHTNARSLDADREMSSVKNSRVLHIFACLPLPPQGLIQAAAFRFGISPGPVPLTMAFPPILAKPRPPAATAPAAPPVPSAAGAGAEAQRLERERAENIRRKNLAMERCGLREAREEQPALGGRGGGDGGGGGAAAAPGGGGGGGSGAAAGGSGGGNDDEEQGGLPTIVATTSADQRRR